MVLGSCLGQSDQEMVEFSILDEVRTGGVSKTATLDFQRADFESFRTLVGRVLWKSVLKGREVQEDWILLKKEVFKVQKQAVPVCRKMSQRGRKLAWLNRELFLSGRKKKRVYVQWKKGQATWGEYKLPAYAEQKPGRPKPSMSSIWPLWLRITENVFINILIARGGPQRISILYWTQRGT